MDLAEVIMEGIGGNGVNVILDLLRKAKGQTSETLSRGKWAFPKEKVQSC